MGADGGLLPGVRVHKLWASGGGPGAAEGAVGLLVCLGEACQRLGLVRGPGVQRGGVTKQLREQRGGTGGGLLSTDPSPKGLSHLTSCK